MKKCILRSLGMACVASLAILFSGCGYVDAWDPEPPYGVNDTFYDSDLDGCWQLYQINGEQVRRDQVNYMQFYGNGRGMYYYYDRGYLENEKLAYWCQRSVSGTSTRQINIKYEYDNPSTMNYWFTNRDTLWMQWRNSYGVQTYVYVWIDRIP
ncbi:MAG: hypothetical protein K2K93_11105 [Muribaculaceae bacterium]|nr:hypothetical protein [Muribaculaceae bacterium]